MIDMWLAARCVLVGKTGGATWMALVGSVKLELEHCMFCIEVSVFYGHGSWHCQ